MNSFNYLPVILFAVTMSVTPGPNNIMLTASGANFGFRKTIPHILGIIIGVAFLNVLSALGLSKLFQVLPNLKTILKILGVTYMLFLSYKIVTSKRHNNGNKRSKPFNFFQAALFQLLNPKAVLMSITSMSVYTITNQYVQSSTAVIIIFMICGLPSISLWAGFGTVIGKLLNNSKILRLFNLIMGGITALCAVIIVI